MMSRSHCTFAILLAVISLTYGWHATESWIRVSSAASEDVLKVTILLKNNNPEKLLEIFHQVTDVKSPSYGKYLSHDEICDIIRPPQHIIEGYTRWLNHIHARNLYWTKGNEAVQFEMSASAVKNFLNLPIAIYHHRTSNRKIIRVDALQLGSATERNQRGRALISAIPLELRDWFDLSLGLFDIFDSKKERRGASRDLQNSLKSSSSPNSSSAQLSSSPVIIQIAGGPTDLNVYFSPVCSDGSTPLSSFLTQCNPPIATFTLTLESHDFHPITITFASQSVRCVSLNSSVSITGSPSVTCVLTAHIPQAFTRTNVTLSTGFSDGSNSPPFKYSTAYAPTEYAIPETIFDLYSIPANLRATHPKNSQAIVSFEEQYISTADLTTFQQLMGLPIQSCNIIGPNDPSSPGAEATLDVQYVMGIGRGVNTTCWSFPVGDYILNWALAVANNSLPPLVTSISYGDTEVGYEQKAGYGLQYIHRMNFELVKMSTRGLTVIAGSGDAGWSNVGEMGNDLSAPDPTCTPSRAFYPSVSPWVMSLSSTFIGINSVPVCSSSLSVLPGVKAIAVPVICNRVGEIAVSVRNGMSWTTGGGFSNVTTRHVYQEQAVSTYLSTAKNLPPSQYWNKNGQGYADIATVGWNQLIVWYGELFPVGGTSASGPVAAGIFSLLNDIRLNQNKPPLGFVNPQLYEWARTNPAAFNDITVGENNDGDIQPPGSSYPTYCEYGFSTAAGWDPVTGLGTPNFSVLSQLVVSL